MITIRGNRTPSTKPYNDAVLKSLFVTEFYLSTKTQSVLTDFYLIPLIKLELETFKYICIPILTILKSLNETNYCNGDYITIVETEAINISVMTIGQDSILVLVY